MQVHGKGTIAVICELINVDVKLNGYGKQVSIAGLLNTLNAENTTQEFHISHK